MFTNLLRECVEKNKSAIVIGIGLGIITEELLNDFFSSNFLFGLGICLVSLFFMSDDRI
jgi:hypothetical protein